MQGKFLECPVSYASVPIPGRRANIMRGEAALPPNASAHRTKSEMKCTNCGFPISPSRTPRQCPRCGMSTTGAPQPDPRLAQQHFESNREMSQRGNGNYT